MTTRFRSLALGISAGCVATALFALTALTREPPEPRLEPGPTSREHAHVEQRAREDRVPTPATVVGAHQEREPDPTPASPRVDRESLIASIATSAPSTAEWTEVPRTVFTRFIATAPAELARRVRIDAVDCRARGCLATATYADIGAIQRVDAAISELPEFATYAGWRHRSPPTALPSGEYQATWVFFPPS